MNRYNPHVLILPEDQADRELAIGFLLEVDSARRRQVRILPNAGGWREVVTRFNIDEAGKMRDYVERFIILLVDFDNKIERLNEVRVQIPDDLKDRVFILGALGEPEDLSKAGLGSGETIGTNLAKDCRENTDALWDHDLLRHNAGELDRLRKTVRPILFESL